MAASLEQADRLAQVGFGCLVGAHDDERLADMAGQHGRVRRHQRRRRIEQDDPAPVAGDELRQHLPEYDPKRAAPAHYWLCAPPAGPRGPARRCG